MRPSGLGTLLQDVETWPLRSLDFQTSFVGRRSRFDRGLRGLARSVLETVVFYPYGLPGQVFTFGPKGKQLIVAGKVGREDRWLVAASQKRSCLHGSRDTRYLSKSDL